MAEAEYKILVRRKKCIPGDFEEDTQEALNDAAEELSADVTAHLGNQWMESAWFAVSGHGQGRGYHVHTGALQAKWDHAGWGQAGCNQTPT